MLLPESNFLLQEAKYLNFHKTIRKVHLYTGLFLLPWMLVYATSGLVLNHKGLFQGHLNRVNQYHHLYEQPFVPDGTFPEDLRDQALVILQALDLDGGPYHIKGKPYKNHITIFRWSGSGNYRVTWLRKKDKVLVEKCSFSIISLVNYLHFTKSYNLKYLRYDAWALVVDILALCIWVWGVTGVIMWLRLPRRIPWGMVAVITGWLLFALLVLLLLYF